VAIRGLAIRPERGQRGEPATASRQATSDVLNSRTVRRRFGARVVTRPRWSPRPYTRTGARARVSRAHRASVRWGRGGCDSGLPRRAQRHARLFAATDSGVATMPHSRPRQEWLPQQPDKGRARRGIGEGRPAPDLLWSQTGGNPHWLQPSRRRTGGPPSPRSTSGPCTSRTGQLQR
jgi:hypothetical protein